MAGEAFSPIQSLHRDCVTVWAYRCAKITNIFSEPDVVAVLLGIFVAVTPRSAIACAIFIIETYSLPTLTHVLPPISTSRLSHLCRSRPRGSIRSRLSSPLMPVRFGPFYAWHAVALAKVGRSSHSFHSYFLLLTSYFPGLRAYRATADSSTADWPRRANINKPD